MTPTTDIAATSARVAALTTEALTMLDNGAGEWAALRLAEAARIASSHAKARTRAYAQACDPTRPDPAMTEPQFHAALAAVDAHLTAKSRATAWLGAAR